MPSTDDEYAVTARRALTALAGSLDRALNGREPSRSVVRLRLLEIHELEKRAAMLGDEDLALEMRQAWKHACDRAVAVFGMSMLDQPRPPKLPPVL
jgi:hypothetical protein